jgi:hypothetical protein
MLHCLTTGVAYKAAEGRKQRKHHLAELKGLLPPSQTPLLVTLLLEQHTLFTQQELPPAAAAAAASGAADRLAAGYQQQEGAAAAAAAATGFSPAAQEAGELPAHVRHVSGFLSSIQTQAGIAIRRDLHH